MITIGKANFDFEAENQPFIQSLYGDWDHFFRVSFENVVEEVLMRYDNQEELIRVESLTVDMGTLTEEEFREQFPRILACKLADIFSAYLLNKEAHPEEISVISISRSHMEKLSFYLLQGYIRWDEEGGAWNFSQVIQQVLQSDRAALCLFLQVNGGKISLRERLVFQLSDDVLEMLAVAVLPSDSSFVTPYIRFLIASHKSLKRPEIREEDYRNIVWMVVWGYLFSESKGYFSRKKLVAYTLQHLSAHYNIEFNTLLNLLIIGLKEYVSSLLVIPELFAILSEIRSELSGGNRPESVYRSLSGDELISRLSAHEETEKMRFRLADFLITGEVEEGRVDEAKDSFVKPDNPVVTEERSRTYIHNAGLVILAPYFPRLFRVLQLMDVPVCLKDRDAMVKGIFSLQYLVYGDREFPEHELLLNKLLTGYAMNKPLPRFSPLEADECEILVSLLKGAMQNWQKMKNTSTEGFRSSFLQRNGVLEELDDRWLLTVEQRAFDVLLDSIPWSYTPVKYAWMKKPLYVKWRD